ncbi:MAG: glycosyltransferase [Planctomycetes bacterium]|nr:glycosyltransferase [Planctomycetota bacterium]
MSATVSTRIPPPLPDLLLVGGTPYFSPYPSPRPHFARAWNALGGRVLYVEVGGPAAFYRERLRQSGGEEPVQDRPGLFVWRFEKFLGLPYSYPDFTRRWNLQFRLPALKRMLERIGFADDRFVALYYGWWWAEWMEGLRASHHVYDCVDEHRAYPDFDGNPDRAAYVWEQEVRMLERTDLLLATSPALLDDRIEHVNAWRYLPHAVDLEAYAPCIDSMLPEPGDLELLPQPRAMVMGTLTAKLDFGALEHLAAAMPAGSVVLVGPPGRGVKPRAMDARLKWLGPKPAVMLPSYFAYAQAGMIPLLPTPFNYGSSPLKLLEYLAAGLPVVASRNPVTEEMAQAAPGVFLADSAAEFPEALRLALEAGERLGRAEIRKAVEGRSYAARALELAEALAAPVESAESAESGTPA